MEFFTDLAETCLNEMTHSKIEEQPLAIPSPRSLKQQLNASSKQRQFIQSSRDEICKILTGQDSKFLLILGPCSIHDLTAAKEYALKLKALQCEFGNTFLFVMRTYFEKPRTTLGWKGMIYDPHLDGTNDIHEGLKRSRELLLFLADLEIAAATEFLDPATPSYLSDLISWSCIGARTVESQVHRQLASSLRMPVAFKNSTSGNIDVAINGIISAAAPHTFLGINDDGQLSIQKTKGNKNCHLTLRGGDGKPNYDPESIEKATLQLKRNNLPQKIIIDCSHDNASCCFSEQSTVFLSVIDQRANGNSAICGLALESHLNAGNQPIPADLNDLKYAVSLTDPCLSWDATVDLVRWAKARLNA